MPIFGRFVAIPAILLLAISIVATVASSQVATEYHPAFEVASIRELQPGIIQTQTRPGMHISGTRVDCAMQLSSLIATAYRLKTFQISGPDSLELRRFVIRATIPDGATKDQVPEMLKSLLADRLKMVAHWEEKSRPVYALVVAEGGPKLKKATESDGSINSLGANATGTPESSSDTYYTTDGQQIMERQEGTTTLKIGGRVGTVRSRVANMIMYMELPKVTMDAFAEETLADMINDRPVVNRTNLKGFFEVTMEFPLIEYLRYITRNTPKDAYVSSVLSPFGGGAGTPAADAGMSASDPSGELVFRAVQKLGLMLQSQKAPVKQLIIDHVDKDPTEN
jgi:uncharacterized protein (TIGR03435 family)